MGKELKTNAMRFLDKNNIEYQIQTYECKEFTSGTQTALALGQSPDMTFKTLVAEGKTGGHYCFLIPVDMKLDLKKASASVGEVRTAYTCKRYKQSHRLCKGRLYSHRHEKTVPRCGTHIRTKFPYVLYKRWEDRHSALSLS